jgi:hypothetical protein
MVMRLIPTILLFGLSNAVAAGPVRPALVAKATAKARPKTRLLAAAEIAESAKVAGLDPDDVDAKQAFETDAFGAPTRILVAPGKKGIALFLVRGGKLLETHDTGCISGACGEEITAVVFEDLDGDGLFDLAAVVHSTGLAGVGDDGKRMEIDSEDGMVLLQKPDGSFAEHPLGLMQLGKSSKCELAALKASKPLTLKALRAAFRCEAKSGK